MLYSVKHEHLNKSSMFLLKAGLVLHLMMMVGRQVLSLHKNNTGYNYFVWSWYVVGLIKFFVGTVVRLTSFLKPVLLNTGFLTFRLLDFHVEDWCNSFAVPLSQPTSVQPFGPFPKMVLCSLSVDHDRVEANIEKHWQVKTQKQGFMFTGCCISSLLSKNLPLDRQVGIKQ